MHALEATGRFELAPSVMYGGALKNVEVNRKGVHKGRGLERLAAHLGFSMQQVMAVGDSDNDLTMLRQAGLSVAMGNAPAHIRAAADACTADHTEKWGREGDRTVFAGGTDMKKGYGDRGAAH